MQIKIKPLKYTKRQTKIVSFDGLSERFHVSDSTNVWRQSVRLHGGDMIFFLLQQDCLTSRCNVTGYKIQAAVFFYGLKLSGVFKLRFYG